MFTDIMIDLETFALTPDAAIRSIGAVAFDIDNADPLFAFQPFYVNVNDPAGRLERGTIEWWSTQPEAEKYLGKEQLTLIESLRHFQEWIRSVALPEQATRVWSNGAAFDIPIVKQAWNRAHGDGTPFDLWSYRNERDTRTLYWLAEKITGWRYAKPKHGTKHHALDDAQNEAVAAQNAWRALKALQTGNTVWL